MIDMKQEITFVLTQKSKGFNYLKEKATLSVYSKGSRYVTYLIKSTISDLVASECSLNGSHEVNANSLVQVTCDKCGATFYKKLIGLLVKIKTNKADKYQNKCHDCLPHKTSTNVPMYGKTDENFRVQKLSTSSFYMYRGYGGRRDLIPNDKIVLPKIERLDVNADTKEAAGDLRSWLNAHGFSVKADAVKRFKNGKQFIAVAVFPATKDSYRGYAYIAIAITNQELFPIFIDSIGERISFNKWMNLN